jgi:transcriptional regulator with XRE-family HTH domain
MARKNKGYSKAELATRMGVKISTIEKWEKEITTPRANKLHIMSGILSVPLLWLMAGADHIPDSSGAYTDQEAINFKLEKAEQGLRELGSLLAEIKILVQNCET